MNGPAYRIETDHLVLRCWNPPDAPLLHTAIGESLDHLRNSMPWVAQEPLSLDARIERLRGMRASFDRGEDFSYGVFAPDESAVLGGGGLHTRQGAGSREIGYWIHPSHLRRGYATEISAALTRVAFEVDQVLRVEIRVDAANTISARIPPKLGFTREGVLRRRLAPLRDGGELRDAVIFTLLAEEYPSTPCAAVKLAAFDAARRPILLRA